MKSLFCLWQRTSVLILIPFFLVNASVNANERAHEHGVGALSIAVEGHDVEVELTVPGSDVVGFEHAPSSEGERNAVAAGVKVLRDVNGIISLSLAAKCRIESVEVTSGLMEEKSDHVDDHKHKHESKHGHDHKDKHKDDHKEVHGEFISHYHFHCDDPNKLTGAKLGFFKAFPSAHELDAKWITPKGQGAKELTAKTPSLEF